MPNPQLIPVAGALAGKGLDPLSFFSGIVLSVSVFLIIYPVLLFLHYLNREILLLSPALLFMILGGIVGITTILPQKGGI